MNRIVKSFILQGGRDYQQDYIYEGDNLYLLADGVGGATAGEMASKFICDFFKGELENLTESSVLDTNWWGALAYKASVQLQEFAYDNGIMGNMGSTLCLLFVHNEQFWIAHKGDSRIYHIRKSHNKFWATKDHSLVQELYDRGMIKEVEMHTHPQKNVVTNVFQSHPNSKAGYLSVQRLDDIQKDDLFLLCSDGTLEPFPLHQHVKVFLDQNWELDDYVDYVKKKCANISRDNSSAIFVQLK